MAVQKDFPEILEWAPGSLFCVCTEFRLQVCLDYFQTADGLAHNLASRSGCQPNAFHALNVVVITGVRDVRVNNFPLTILAKKLAANRDTCGLRLITDNTTVHRSLFHSVSPT
jgi:hypothetical protein